MDKLTKEQRRKNMQAVRSSGTVPEIILAKALFARGLRYRKNDKTVFGKPDIVFKSIKLAVFVDGEFWHGKDWSKRKLDHKSNINFWVKKIEGNIKRDKKVNRILKKQGWTVLRFWSKIVLKQKDLCVNKVVNAINANKQRN